MINIAIIYIYIIYTYIYLLYIYIIYIYIYHYRSIQFATNQTQLEPQPDMASTPPPALSPAPLNWWYTEICPACLPLSKAQQWDERGDHQPTWINRPFGMAAWLYCYPSKNACWWCLSMFILGFTVPQSVLLPETGDGTWKYQDVDEVDLGWPYEARKFGRPGPRMS